MELTPRKQAVLKAIVKAYIETGEPIGSKNLTAMLENAPSSATLRNEMSELCELGLLHQPHTSAGRIPTSLGYRFYVDNLFEKAKLDFEISEFIDNSISNLGCEAEEIPNIAAQVLSKLTGLPAIACLINEKPPRVKRIELLPIGRSSLMLLLITSDGRTRNRVLRTASGLGSTALTDFEELINRRIIGKEISKLTKAYMQSVIAEAGINSLTLMPFLSAIFEAALEIEETDVTIKGENALYNICADESTARKIINLIKQRDPIISILENIGDNVGAVFGADTSYTELRYDTVIAAKFNGFDKYRGYIGVIGPNRMSYEQIMPVIEYTAERLSHIMTEAQKDMED
ncbi:MAG: heat-inducible transcription repressor HrcA [Clostridia bacterium]|nr:heat-inducible transcription repressor HrcA [Clostridia bacterium]